MFQKYLRPYSSLQLPSDGAFISPYQYLTTVVSFSDVDTLFAVAMCIPVDLHIIDAGFYITVGSTPGIQNVILGIYQYDIKTGLPTNKIKDTGPIALNTTGYKSGPLGINLPAGVYAIVWINEIYVTAAVVRRATLHVEYPSFRDWTGYSIVQALTYAYTSLLPDVLPDSGWFESKGNIHRPVLRVNSR